MSDLEAHDIRRMLGTPDTNDAWSLTRRRFLQASLAVGGATMLPSWFDKVAEAATPLGATDGILVLVQLSGGNDGLRTVAPVGDAAYAGLRPTLAISPANALGLGLGLGLHPGLTTLKKYYDLGKMAVVTGVGDPSNPDLSHFTSMAKWMQGSAKSASSGWLGRYMDGLGGDPLTGISIGSDVPLQIVGDSVRGLSVPDNLGGALGVDQSHDYDRRMYKAVRDMAAGPTGLGTWGDALATVGSQTIDLGQRISTAYKASLPNSSLERQMALAARLINLNVGIRVVCTEMGGFDNHNAEAGSHDQLMANLDTACGRFFAELSPDYLNRVTVMTFSEFGRRVKENDSQGTDHGTASCLFVIGNRVRGGLYGNQPSLTSRDSTDNLVASVDFRSVYASVLNGWLRADSTQILGATYTDLALFDPPTDVATPGGLGSAGAGSIATAPTSGYWLLTSGGDVKPFGNATPVGTPGAGVPIVGAATTPSRKGFFAVRANGKVHAHGDASHHGEITGMALNAPMVGIASTPTGNGYWLLGGDGGIFTFGDAKFYGSTGAMRLVRPVVGMAATPTGKGYWLTASDGGVFTFGDAQFYGSMGAVRLNSPVVGMARSKSGKGYWLVAADGGIFTFGDAQFYGSTGNLKLAKPITGMISSPSGKGYLFVATDGGVFTFGDAKFQGSLGNNPPATPVVGIAG